MLNNIRYILIMLTLPLTLLAEPMPDIIQDRADKTFTHDSLLSFISHHIIFVVFLIVASVLIYHFFIRKK